MLCTSGRLVEIRPTSGYKSVADVDEILLEITRAVKKVPTHEKLIVVTDWRKFPVMASNACERLLT